MESSCHNQKISIRKSKVFGDSQNQGPKSHKFSSALQPTEPVSDHLLQYMFCFRHVGGFLKWGGPPYHPKLDHFSIETEKDTYGDGWGPPMTSEPPLLLQVDQVESRIPSVCSKGCHKFHVFLFRYTSGGTKFIFLDVFTKHQSRSTADDISKSVLCGRRGTVNCHLLF